MKPGIAILIGGQRVDGWAREFGTFIRSETARFKKVIEMAGLRVE